MDGVVGLVPLAAHIADVGANARFARPEGSKSGSRGGSTSISRRACRRLVLAVYRPAGLIYAYVWRIARRA